MNAVPIVGQPVAFGTGFIALVVVGLSTLVARYFYLLAVQGGHLLAAAFLFRGIGGYEITDAGGSLGVYLGQRSFLINLAGFATPPLMGLGGAALIARGNAFAALFIAALFSALALFVAANGLARLIPALVIAGIFAVGLYGSAVQQATVAVGLVWFLLISGAVYAFRIRVGVGDPEALRRRLVLPGALWQLIWIVIAVVSLFVGGRLLLVPGA